MISNFYMGSMGLIRSGARAWDMSKLTTRNDLEFLFVVYREITCNADTCGVFSQAEGKYIDFMLSEGLRTTDNLCTPPTQTDLHAFDSTLTVKEPWGRGTRDVRHSCANDWISHVTKFWDWYIRETEAEHE